MYFEPFIIYRRILYIMSELNENIKVDETIKDTNDNEENLETILKVDLFSVS